MTLLPTRSPRGDGAGVRILLHSHDSFGLGHLRRTTTIAEALRGSLPQADLLITTGSPVATHFAASGVRSEIGAGVEIVKLPSITKSPSGQYVPRSLSGHLAPVIDLRRRILREIVEGFAPDLWIVDHQVLGLADELDPLLGDAHAAGTRTILGIRDIIDAPEVVEREWGRPAVRAALAGHYDRICVYGAPEVFDPRVEYPIPPELAERLEFTGYVARPAPAARVARAGSARPSVLVTVGGGEDGAARIETYLEALEAGAVPWTSRIVLGPLLDGARARTLKRRARSIPGVELHHFHADLPRLLASSDAVVAMAGYNSAVEILQSRVPAVLCPRSFPRREQLLRAERLADLGLLECLPAPTAETLRSAVARALARGRTRGALPPLDGCARLCAVVRDLCSLPAAVPARARARRTS